MVHYLALSKLTLAIQKNFRVITLILPAMTVLMSEAVLAQTINSDEEKVAIPQKWKSPSTPYHSIIRALSPDGINAAGYANSSNDNLDPIVDNYGDFYTREWAGYVAGYSAQYTDRTLSELAYSPGDSRFYQQVLTKTAGGQITAISENTRVASGFFTTQKTKKDPNTGLYNTIYYAHPIILRASVECQSFSPKYCYTGWAEPIRLKLPSQTIRDLIYINGIDHNEGWVSALSDDGTVAAGAGHTADNQTTYQALIWKEVRGVWEYGQDIGVLLTGDFDTENPSNTKFMRSAITRLSADGRVAAGIASDRNNYFYPRPAIWRSEDGDSWTGEFLPQYETPSPGQGTDHVLALSADGTVAAGRLSAYYGERFYKDYLTIWRYDGNTWRAPINIQKQNNMQDIPGLAHAYIRALSQDGRVAAGFYRAYDETERGWFDHALIWYGEAGSDDLTKDWGKQLLVAPKAFASAIHALSRDATVAGGWTMATKYDHKSATLWSIDWKSAPLPLSALPPLPIIEDKPQEQEDGGTASPDGEKPVTGDASSPSQQATGADGEKPVTGDASSPSQQATGADGEKPVTGDASSPSQQATGADGEKPVAGDASSPSQQATGADGEKPVTGDASSPSQQAIGADGEKSVAGDASSPSQQTTGPDGVKPAAGDASSPSQQATGPDGAKPAAGDASTAPVIVMLDVTTTQHTLSHMASDTFSMMALQHQALHRLRNTCQTSASLCFSEHLDYSSQNTHHDGASGFTLGYRLHQNFSAGFTLDRPLWRKLPDSYHNSSNSLGTGIYFQWQPSESWYLRPALAVNHFNTDVRRAALPFTEAGNGNSTLRSMEWSLEGGQQHLAINSRLSSSWHFGLRHTSLSQSGWTENNVRFPVTYASVNWRSISLYSGVDLSLTLSNNLQWYIGGELEQTIHNNQPVWQAKAEYIGDFRQAVSMQKTRGYLYTGVAYHLLPGISLSLTPSVGKTLTGDTSWNISASLNSRF